MKKLLTSILSASFLAASVSAFAEEAKGPSLYERIGGEPVAREIVSDIWDNHGKNPIVKNRFTYSDPVYVKQKVFEIFAMATGGPVEYTGGDMKSVHATMNISEMEFNAVVDDIMLALDENAIGQQEKNEILAILWSVRPDIVNSNVTTNALAPAAKAQPAH